MDEYRAAAAEHGFSLTDEQVARLIRHGVTVSAWRHDLARAADLRDNPPKTAEEGWRRFQEAFRASLAEHLTAPPNYEP